MKLYARVKLWWWKWRTNVIREDVSYVPARRPRPAIAAPPELVAMFHLADQNAWTAVLDFGNNPTHYSVLRFDSIRVRELELVHRALINVFEDSRVEWPDVPRNHKLTVTQYISSSNEQLRKAERRFGR